MQDWWREYGRVSMRTFEIDGSPTISMEKVYVLIQCDLGKETDIIAELTGIPEVKEVRGTYGIYDIFCKIEAERDVLDKIIAKIRQIPRIRSTITLHWIPSQGGR
ncbi:transcriptional regulator [Cenarchaeum symbiosum A]|uniref:Transcriptional regulator n=1 Tax=Cenarchaeum symbiosum (strain A) TaxID=414004 RepID=A0RTU8_CENSY|nr:transcriptional regulator [Cenarchaeum symbiosum A]